VGVWSWGDKGYWGYGTEYSEADVRAAYQTSLDAGLNFFDTAEVYGNGESERLLGKCVRSDPRPVVIASKFAPLPFRFSANEIHSALDNSLKRLGLPRLDLYQIHWPYSLLKIENLMDAMAEAVKTGKIRAVGVSNYSAEQMKRAHERLARYEIPLASNQVQYNLLKRAPEANGVLDTCRQLNVALIAYSPLAQGILTDKYRNNGPRPLKGMRRFQANFRESSMRKNRPLLATLADIATAHEKSVEQVALNWLLAKDELVIPIPGAKTAKQAAANAGALGWKLTAEEVARLDQASASPLR
jgi:aryl-alcohol dehydrogenase-like predicted oxidoreductase